MTGDLPTNTVVSGNDFTYKRDSNHWICIRGVCIMPLELLKLFSLAVKYNDGKDWGKIAYAFPNSYKLPYFEIVAIKKLIGVDARPATKEEVDIALATKAFQFFEKRILNLPYRQMGEISSDYGSYHTKDDEYLKFLREWVLNTAKDDTALSSYSIVVLKQERWDRCIEEGHNLVEYLILNEDYVIVPMKATNPQQYGFMIDTEGLLREFGKGNPIYNEAFERKLLVRTVTREILEHVLAQYAKTDSCVI